MREGTVFYACRRCHENDCSCKPEDDSTRFVRRYTATASGYADCTIDDDGDVIEGDPSGWDDDNNEEPGDYLSCQCCSHDIYTPKVTTGYKSVHSLDPIVGLWQDDLTENVYTLEYAQSVGWVAQDDEDDEDDVDDSELAAREQIREHDAMRDSSRSLSGDATSLAAMIGSITEDVGPDTNEITLTFQ